MQTTLETCNLRTARWHLGFYKRKARSCLLISLFLVEKEINYIEEKKTKSNRRNEYFLFIKKYIFLLNLKWPFTVCQPFYVWNALWLWIANIKISKYGKFKIRLVVLGFFAIHPLTYKRNFFFWNTTYQRIYFFSWHFKIQILLPV